MSNTEQLMEDTLESLYDYLPKMIQGIDQFVAKMMIQNQTNALEILPNIFEGLNWITQAVLLTQPLQKVPLNGQELVLILPALMDAYENQDLILVSDLLDYEIKPMIEKWTHQIQ